MLAKLKKLEYLKYFLPLILGVIYYFSKGLMIASIIYVVGWYVGILLMILDKKRLYRFYYESIHQKEDRFARLITRSLLFMIAYVVLAVFLITSSGSSLGVGIVLGIGAVLAEEVWLSRKYVEFFNQYFIQSNKKWTAREIERLAYFAMAFFVLSSIFSVI